MAGAGPEVVTDLDPPDRILARWGVLAAAFAAIGEPDVFGCGETGAELDDSGGNWAALGFGGAGRLVCFGYDHEYSETVLADPPIDLLAGAPAWLPWDRLIELSEDDQLGWCYWWDDGRWLRAPGSGRTPDGLRAAAGPVLSEESALEFLRGVILDWSDPDPAPDPADVVGGAVQLLTAADGRAITAEALAGFLSLGREVTAEQLAAGVAAAAYAGLTPGASSPLDRPAVADRAPVSRRRRVLSMEGHDALARETARAATELPRPEPREGGEVRDLVKWLRKHDKLTAEGVTFQVADTGGTAQGLTGVRGEEWRTAFGLAERVRIAEASPERGAWTWLRVRASGRRGAELTRAYDHLPEWWPSRGLMDSFPTESLRAEMDSRAPQWRPPWIAVLDPGTAWGPVPPS